MVMNGDQAETDGLDALRTLLLAEAIYQAASESRTVGVEAGPELVKQAIPSTGWGK